MQPWVMWAIVVIALMTIEILSSSFYAMCLAVGALLSAILAAIGLGLEWQLAAFAVGSTLAFIFVRPVMKKYFFKKDEVKTNVDALVGQIGRVSETIDPRAATGRVAVGGDDWKAVSIHGEHIAAGESVRVERVDSTIVYVKKINTH
ncbi:MAG: NfeD family protein [Rikenellaceae bacterium]|nr:NfeD family protein [Rikenellaceae bacterium]MCL2692152.1 NfeD family protein [Rikenellaceae bacterium]